MRWVIGALICAGSLLAQVNGPFEIAAVQSPSELSTAKVAVDSAGIAHIFFERNDNGARFIMYATVDASSGEVITEPEAVYFALAFRVFLEDVAITPSGTPKCLVFTADPSDYNLLLVQRSEGSWTETLLFHDQDGWSPNGPDRHWIEYCRFVAAEDSFTQVSLFSTGTAGGWINEPFASPVACFVNAAGDITTSLLNYGGQMTFGAMRSQSLSADSMYCWVDGNFGEFVKLIARSDSTSEVVASYSSDACPYGELAGIPVSGGDQVHVTGMTLCIPACLVFERISGDSCVVINEVLVYPPMNLPGSFAVCEQQGFVFPLFDQNEVQLLRVDTLGEIAAAVGTIAWRDGDVQIVSANCGVSHSGEIAAVYTDHDPAAGSYRLWLASCDWLTPLEAQSPPVLFPKAFFLRTFPNPFNSAVEIEYDLLAAANVRLSIFNTLGQEIATLVDGRSEAGTHTLAWSPTGASGVYFVKLVAEEFVTSQKILFIR